jgi:CheY-like chemotaxis protein
MLSSSKSAHVVFFDPSGKSSPNVLPYLVASGFSVEPCLSAEDFESLWARKSRASDVDLVIIDLDEHEREGFDIAKEIRRRKVQKPEIIFASSNPKVTLFDCHQAGGIGLIEKPYNVVEIRELALRLSERRRFPRIDVKDIQGMVVDPQSKEVIRSAVGNIGRGGFFFHLDFGHSPPEIGQIVDFQIRVDAFPNYVIEGKGIIRWIKGSPGPGAGVEFLSISEENYLVLQAFVELFKIQPYLPSN